MSDLVLYNEIDPHAAQWTRNLVAAGHIAPGDVDTRSIIDLRHADVAGRAQFHAFAGIAGWSLALRLAGWPDDMPVWTGSCPCQPFSAAGQRKGFDDDRHLWPAWFRLIRECRPPVVFGEQVEAAVRHGWLDAVFSDLEGEGYACGSAVLGAHSVGAPHIRQRLWFVAHARSEGRGQVGPLVRGGAEGSRAEGLYQRPLHGGPRILADANCRQRDGIAGGEECERDGPATGRVEGDRQPEHGRAACGLGDASFAGSRRHAGAVPGAEGESASERGGAGREPDEPFAAGAAGGMGNAADTRQRRSEDARTDRDNSGPLPRGGQGKPGILEPERASCLGGFWSDADWIPCRDGKARPVEPGTFPLAHGIPGRVGRLRAYGNAIVPQVAATFISAFLASLAQQEAA